ncbi:MAG: CpaF family protein [Anaerolineae bacterium]|nr:CpaF family protein [Anaerolineae bacterium]
MSVMRRLNDPSRKPNETPDINYGSASDTPEPPPQPSVTAYTGTMNKIIMPPKLVNLRKQLRARVLRTPDEADTWQRGEADKVALIAERLRQIIEKLASEKPEFRLNQAELTLLREAILDDVLGFGAIQPLVDDRSVSEIMVNGPQHIWKEQKGVISESEHTYDDEDHVLWTVQRIIRPMGRQLNREHPMVDARLPDGSRVHIVTLPSALNGTTITIRKFPERRMTVEDLINYGSFTRETAEFLKACVVSRMNVVVSGGTGSGKTTLLNVLSGYIPDEERIITIEDSAELQLNQRHVVRLETSPPIPDGDGKIGALTVRDLVRGSLRMRPERIIIGECRGGEALDMLSAMNTGHDGSMTTVHANNPRDSVARIETLVLMSGMDLPLITVRKQIVSAVDLIVQIARLRDGSRKITQVSEIQGMEGENVILQDIFIYRMPGSNSSSPATVGGGKLESTGFRPKFIERLEENGFRLSGRIFGAGQNTFVKTNL